MFPFDFAEIYCNRHTADPASHRVFIRTATAPLNRGMNCNVELVKYNSLVIESPDAQETGLNPGTEKLPTALEALKDTYALASERHALFAER